MKSELEALKELESIIRDQDYEGMSILLNVALLNIKISKLENMVIALQENQEGFRDESDNYAH